MKKLLLSILLGAALGVGFVQYFDRCVSPDIGFFTKAAEQSDAWAAKLRESDEPCYIICGCSDVRMGVDPALMLEEEGVRAISASLNAGFGQSLVIEEGLSYARPGDTLVYVPLTGETAPGEQPTGSMKLGIIRRGMDVFQPGLVTPTAGNISKIITGDIRAISFYYIKSIMFDRPPYRYNAKTCILHESGWVEILPVLHNKHMRPFPLAPDCDIPTYKHAHVHDLNDLAEKCAERGVALVVQLSVAYGDASMRALHAWEALQYVRMGYKVLKDPSLGVEPDSGLMADTLNHLNTEGARKHTLILAGLLRNGEFWTEEELVQELNRRGWDADGKPLPWWRFSLANPGKRGYDSGRETNPHPHSPASGDGVLGESMATGQ